MSCFFMPVSVLCRFLCGAAPPDLIPFLVVLMVNSAWTSQDTGGICWTLAGPMPPAAKMPSVHYSMGASLQPVIRQRVKSGQPLRRPATEPHHLSAARYLRVQSVQISCAVPTARKCTRAKLRRGYHAKMRIRAGHRSGQSVATLYALPPFCVGYNRTLCPGVG